MQNRFFVMGILVVGLLWQTAVAAQSVTRNGGGATASPVTILVTQRASDTFDFEGTATPSAGASITSYAWNFGDGTTASGSKASHRYAASGWYQVSLTVVDSMRVTASTSTTVVAAAGGGDSTSTGPTSLGIDLVVRGPRYGFTARATPAANSTLKSYSWNFGDGETASGAAAAHYYKASGTYTVVLTVVDSNGAASSTTKIVNASLGNLAPGATSPIASISSSAKSSDTYDFNAAPTRSRVAISSYAWNFGDGSTATGPAVSHRYMSSGTYTVTLTAVASGGASTVATESVSASVGSSSPPTATIIATATASDTFTFSSTASASNGATIVSYAWSFGDGGTATGPTASHRYLASGTYTVTLTVVDSKGASGTATKSVVATVATSPPTVTFDATQTTLDTYTFTGIATAVAGATIASYAWNFGDGSTAGGAATSHQYAASGTYQVVLTVTDSQTKSATATKSVTATVTTPPPPPSGASRVQVSGKPGGTNYANASEFLYSPWVNGGGDWLDKAGVFNGPTATISMPVTVNAPLSIDIGAIDGDLMLTGIYGWSNPTIDGQPAAWFGLDSSSNKSQPVAHWNNPGMILNPARGHTLTLTPNANPLGQTLRIDKVAGPLINDYPFVGPSNKPDIIDLDMTNYAAILAASNGGAIASPFAYNPEFGVDASGMKYLRFSNSTSNPNQRLVDWALLFPGGGRDTAYTRYCLYIESDVRTAFNELGMKLPGPNNNNIAGQLEIAALVTEHGQPAPDNNDLYGLVTYIHDWQADNALGGYADVTSIGKVVFRANQWYCVEQYSNLGTPGVADGAITYWVNGTLVRQITGRHIRNLSSTKLIYMNVLFYHGGMQFPVGTMHYRVAKVAVSSSRIGVPQELLGAGPPSPPTSYPAWRKAMPQTNTLYQIQNTSNMNGTTSQPATINTWNGLIATPTAWYQALGGGHLDSAENKVMKIDLTADAPQWVLFDAGTPSPGIDVQYQSDGKPASRHTYYAGQYIAARNRIMEFGSTGAYGGGAQFVPPGVPPPHYNVAIDGFNLATNAWDPEGTWQDEVSHSPNESIAKHPVTEDVYWSGDGTFNKWTQKTAMSAQLGGNFFGPTMNGKASLIDVTSGRNRYMGFTDQGVVWCVDLTTLASTVHAVTGDITNSPSWAGVTHANGFNNYGTAVHDLDADRYLFVQGNGLYAIDPNTWVSTFILTVPAAASGVNNRLAYFSKFGGIMYLSEFASNILFMPTR